MLTKAVVKAPAKLNLALDIVGLNEKGYHLMAMIMQTIDLYDEITVTRKDSGGILLSCNQEHIPLNEKNICYKCAEAFFRAMELPEEERNLHIHMEKIIPQQAGMAGGSADGAGVLTALNRIYDAGFSAEQLCEIGAAIGADIPFCLTGGTAKVEGIGEKITKIADFPDCTFLIAKPKGGISTQKAFSDFDSAGIQPVLSLEKMVKAIEEKDYNAISEHFYNALERVCPLEEVFQIRNSMMGMGAKGSMMTGSGSAVFGMFLDRRRAYDCEQRLRNRYQDCFLCRPVAEGPVIVSES